MQFLLKSGGAPLRMGPCSASGGFCSKWAWKPPSLPVGLRGGGSTLLTAAWTRALEASDLAWVAERRKGLQDAVNIDVQAARALPGRLPAGGLREAYQSAIIGDMVVRATTRHWQGHDGCCLCVL